jgi:hypothetical protein
MVHASLHATAACSHADMGSAPHVPYLPPEVHHIIARHIDFADLPNYRLVSKSCAEVGTPELFRTISFHCSSASMARIDAVKACEHLNKHVNTLVWDTNMWSIPNVRDYHEWVAYFRRKAHLQITEYMAVKLAPDQLLELANSHSEWEHYLDCVEDERAAKRYSNLQMFFGGFKSLYKLRVLNGQLATMPRGIEKTYLYPYAPEPDGPVAYYRGESLHNGDAYSHQRPGSWVCASFQNIGSIAWHLTKLRMDTVHWRAFDEAFDNVSSLQQLLSLHLTIGFEAEQCGAVQNRGIEYTFSDARGVFRRHHLMDFLVNLPKLQSLKLDFTRGFQRSGELFRRAASTISDLFSEHHTWPNLQKLSLNDVDSTRDAFLSLLERHCSTLKVLDLHNIWFEPHDSEDDISQVAFTVELPEVVVKMHNIMDLERARWTGFLGRTLDETYEVEVVDNIGWDLWDDRIVPSVAEYLVKGGVCPLNDNNMIERDSSESGHDSSESE